MNPPRPRRILMTADAVGGVWTYAMGLVRALCSEGDQVTLVVMGPAPRRDQLEPLCAIQGLDVEVTDLALEWMDPEGADVPRARETLQRVTDRVAPNLIHLNSYREAIFDWPAPVLVVAHSCVCSWWQACRGGMPTEARWRNYAVAVEVGLTAADAWVAPTAAFRDVIDAIYRPRTDGHVIWNGIDVPDEAAPKQAFILAAGRLWDEAKNLAGFAAMAPSLDWPARVAGPMCEPDASPNEGIVDGIDCLGPLPRSALIAEMRRAGIFVSPALYEPFGLSVLEAAASGCALVLADIPTFRELWNGAALFVDPRDDAALLAELHTLSGDEPLREQMQSAAQMRARRYSLARMTAAYRDVYSQVQLSAVAQATCPSVATLELRA